MIYLKTPLIEVDEKTIYTECADSFRDKTALGYAEKVADSASIYELYGPRDVKKIPIFNIEDGDKRKIIKVYDEKFAKKDSVGRKYYEAIMSNAGGRCPICGNGKLKNLDHFLPKSKYPLLCVIPANLIPVCRDCNFDKGDDFSDEYYSMPFNPYFDTMCNVWLECNIDYKSDGSCEIIYRNGFDQTLDYFMWKKYETHFKTFDLNGTFSAKACEEIEDCKSMYKKLLHECGNDGVKEAIISRKESCESNDVNSWRSALYRELEREIERYCYWLASLC